MRDFIRTITGDMHPGELGICHAHEHTIILRGRSCEVNGALLLDDPAKTVAELIDFKTAGGDWLIDAQPIGPERSPSLMKTVSEKSGIKIVATTGFHRGRFYRDDHFVHSATAERLAEICIREIERGMIEYAESDPEETKIKAGLVKFTSEYHHISNLARKAVEVAAMTHLRTGVPIITHTELGTCGPEQVELVTKFGVPGSTVIVSHLDRNPDRFLHKEIASSGAFLVYDGIARTKYWPDSTIIELILEMLDAGFGDRVMLGMDAATRTTWRHYGGGPGLDYLLKRFIPRLKSAGASDLDIDRMLIENPKTAFAFRLGER